MEGILSKCQLEMSIKKMVGINILCIFKIFMFL